SSLALDGLGNSSCHENRGGGVKYWQIILNKMTKAGFSVGWVSVLDHCGRTVWIVDAHREGKRLSSVPMKS
ncbi:MAG: hypothetical protein DMF32_00525, partial [Verrucomicrobia bacterium]